MEMLDLSPPHRGKDLQHRIMGMDRYLNEDVLKILQYSFEQVYPSERVSQLFHEGGHVFSKHLQLTIGCYTQRLSSQPIRASRPNGEEEIIEIFTTLLDLNSSEAAFLWNEFALQVNNNRDARFSVETLESFLYFYFKERVSLWKSLQELLRIFTYTSHSYHKVLKPIIQSLFARGLLRNCLSTIRSLYEMRIPSFQLRFQDMMRSVTLEAKQSFEMNSSKQLELQSLWVLQMTAEIEYALDTISSLINIFQQQCKQQQQEQQKLSMEECLSFEEFYNLLELCMSHNGTIPEAWLRILDKQSIQSPSSYTNNSTFQHEIRAKLQSIPQYLPILQFKWVSVVTQPLQFTSKYSSSSNVWFTLNGFTEEKAQKLHQLLMDGSSLLSLEIQERIKVRAVTAPNSTVVRIDVSLRLVWYLFLAKPSQANNQEMKSLNDAISGWLESDYDRFDQLVVRVREEQGFEDLLGLMDFVVEPTRLVPVVNPLSQESLTGLAFHAMSEALQDLLNTALYYRYFNSNYGDLSTICCFVERLYRQDPVLCNSFWSFWINQQQQQQHQPADMATSSYPLCTYVQQLLMTTPHEPEYLFRILHALNCDHQSSDQIVDILTGQPVHIITLETAGTLAVSVATHSSSREQHRTPLEHGLSRSPQPLSIATSASTNWMAVRNYASSLTSPRELNGGRVRYLGNTEESVSGENESFSLLKPSLGCEGKILHVSGGDDEDGDRDIESKSVPQETLFTVRWSTQSPWWAVLVDSLHHRGSRTNQSGDRSSERSGERVRKIYFALKLLSSIISFSPVTSWTKFTDQYDDLCLLRVLQGTNNEQYFPQLCEKNISVWSMTVNKIEVPSLFADLRMNAKKIDSLIAFANRFQKQFSEDVFHDFIQVSFQLLRHILQESILYEKNTQPSSIKQLYFCFISTALDSFVTFSKLSDNYKFLINSLLIEMFPVSGPSSLSSRLVRILEADMAPTRVDQSTGAIYEGIRGNMLQNLLTLLSIQSPHFCATQGPYFQLLDIFSSEEGDQNYSLSPYSTQGIANNSNCRISLQRFIKGLRKLGLLVERVSDQALAALFHSLDSKALGYLTISQILSLRDTAHASGTHLVRPVSSGAIDISFVRRSVCTVIGAVMNSPFSDSKISPGLVVLESFLVDLILPFVNYSFQISIHSENLMKSSNTSLITTLIYCFRILSIFMDHVDSTESSGTTLNLVKRVLGIREVYSSLMHCATLLPRYCNRSEKLNKKTTPNQPVEKMKFSTLLKGNTTSQQTESSDPLSSIYPMNFTIAMNNLGSKDLDVILELSEICMNLMNKFLRFLLLENKSSKDELRTVISVLSDRRTQLSSGNRPVSFSGYKNNNLDDFQPTFLAYSMGWMYFPMRSSSSDANQQPSVRLASIQLLSLASILLSKVSIPIRDSPQYMNPLVEILDWNNVIMLCKEINACLRGNVDAVDDDLKIALIRLLITLIDYQPVCLSLMRRCHSVLSKRPADGVWTSRNSNMISTDLAVMDNNRGDEDLLLAVSSLICSDEGPNLYERNPLLLAMTIDFTIRLWSRKDQPVLVATGLKLCHSKLYWLRALDPLLDNLQLGSALIGSMTAYGSEGVEASDHLWSLKEADMLVYCHKILAHASALRLISYVHLGALQSLDSDTNKVALDAVELFFDRANQSHRFITWVRHYIQIYYYPTLIAETEKLSKSLGIELNALVRPQLGDNRRHNSSSKVFRDELIENTLSQVAFLGDSQYVYNIGSISSWNQRAFENGESEQYSYLEELTINVKKLNRMWSILDCQSVLLHHWRVFMEIFVSSQIPRSHRFHRSHSSADSDCGSDISPGTGAPQSPISSRDSLFPGDKRSYCVVKEVASALKSVPCSSVVGAIITLEKCDLMVAMVHHQLKDVHIRTSDPLHAKVETRDLGSSRLNSSKMIELLEIINEAHKKITSDFKSFAPPSDGSVVLTEKQQNPSRYSLDCTISFWEDKKDKINLKILTSILLLLDGLDIDGKRNGNKFDLGQEFLSICQRLFHQTYIILSNEYKRYDFNGIYDERSSLKVSIMKVCMEILGVVIPTYCLDHVPYSARSLASTSLKDSQLCEIHVKLFSAISSSEGVLTQIVIDHDYSDWEDVTGIYPNGSPHTRIPDSKVKRASTQMQTQSDPLQILISIMDLFSKCLQSEILGTTLLSINFIKELTINPVLRTYQQLLTRQPVNKASVYMPYMATSGEISTVFHLWRRVLVFLQRITRNLLPSTTVITQDETGAILHGICDCLQTFAPLLFLSIPSPTTTTRFSIQQLHICKEIISVALGIDDVFRVWRVVVPNIWKELLHRIHHMIHRCCGLLGTDITHQRHLHGNLVAVSRDEQREESSLRSRRRLRRILTSKGVSARIRSVSPNSPQSPSRALGSDSPTSASLSPAQTSGPFYAPKLMSTKSTESMSTSVVATTQPAVETRDDDKGQEVLMYLLIDAQIIMIDILSESLAFLWNVKPSMDEYHNIQQSLDVLPVSTRIFFRIPSWKGLVEGVIAAAVRNPQQHSEKGYSVILSDGSKVDYVPNSNIAYTTPPLFPFSTMDNLRNGSLLTATEQARQDVGSANSLVTSAHLLSLLQFCISTTQADSGTSSTLLNLNGIGLQQLSYWTTVTYITNCEHLSRGFPNPELMREQMMVVRNLLLQRPKLERRSSAQSEMSTSLPISAHTTPPLLRATSSTSSVGCSSSNFLENPEWMVFVEESVRRLESIAEYLGISLIHIESAGKDQFKNTPSPRVKGRGLRDGPQYQDV